MDLFELINGKAFPSIHALMIQPFKGIWEADTSEQKNEAINIFTYVELLCSPKKSNPFYGIAVEDRPSRVKKEVWGDSPPENPSKIMEAVMKYKEMLAIASVSYPLFESSLSAAESLRKNLNNVNLDERTNSGTAVTKPADVTRALKEIPDVIKSLETARAKVNAELIEDTKTRNQREIGQFER